MEFESILQNFLLRVFKYKLKIKKMRFQYKFGSHNCGNNTSHTSENNRRYYVGMPPSL